MQLTKRNRLSPDARHQQLLTLGMQVFGAHAYDTISTDEISRLAGISKGLLYHYFPSKKAYYLATLEAASSQLLAATQVDEQLGALDNLRNSIRLLLDFAAAQPFLFKALVRGGVGTDSETANVVEGVREALATTSTPMPLKAQNKAYDSMAGSEWQSSSVFDGSIPTISPGSKPRRPFILRPSGPSSATPPPGRPPNTVSLARRLVNNFPRTSSSLPHLSRPSCPTARQRSRRLRHRLSASPDTPQQADCERHCPLNHTCCLWP